MITDANKEVDNGTPAAALTRDDLISGITTAFQEAGIKAPAPARTQEETVSKFEQVFSKYQASKESDPDLVKAVGELFAAFKEDVDASTNKVSQSARDYGATEQAKREIALSITKLAGENAGVKSYAGAITERVFQALATDPAARRDFERNGFFSPDAIEKAAAKEVKLLAPEPVTTKAAGGIAGGANAREQAALSKGASDDAPTGGDLDPRNEKEEEFLSAATISVQKAGIPLYKKGSNKEYSEEAAKFLTKKLDLYRKGKEKSRAKAAAR